MRTKIRRERTGCFTCRRRKVKCDQARPICGDCQHLDLECSFPEGSETLHNAQLQRRQSRASVESRESSIVTTPDTTHVILPTTNYGSHFQLFHHFSTIVLPEMSGRHLAVYCEQVPKQNSALAVWTTDIPALAFDNDHVVQALLAIAAKDLEFKHYQSHTERRKYRGLALHHAGSAMHALHTALSSAKSLTPAILTTTLFMLWQSALVNDDVAVEAHFTGVRRILQKMQSELICTDLGRQLLFLFMSIDIALTLTQRAIDDPVVGVAHQEKAFGHLIHEPQFEINSSYELWSITTAYFHLTKSDKTFLQAVAEAPTKDQQQGILNMIEQACLWFICVRESPQFVCHETNPDTWTAAHPFGAVQYRSAEAALLIVHFCALINTLRRDISTNLVPNVLQRWCAIKIRQVLAGAVDAYPSEYSHTLLRRAGSTGIFLPIARTNNVFLNPVVKTWQLNMYDRIEHWYVRSVWEHSQPGFFWYMSAAQRTSFAFLTQPHRSPSSTIAPANLKEDFTEARDADFSDLFEPGSRISTYHVYILEDRILRCLVHSTRVESDGRCYDTIDEEQTRHWTKLASQIDTSVMDQGVVPQYMIDDIIHRAGLSEMIEETYFSHISST